MEISIRKNSAVKVQTLVVFATKDANGKKPIAGDLPPDLKSLLEKASSDGIFSGDKKETALYRNHAVAGAENILFVGLGPANKVDAEQIRNAVCTALQGIKTSKATSAGLWLDSLTKVLKDPGLVTQAATESLLLSSYEFTEMKSAPKKDKSEPKDVTFFAKNPNAAMEKGLQKGKILAECQNFARRLGDLPGNFSTPTILANETLKAAKGTGLKVTIWEKDRIKKERMGGLLSVAAGSSEDPRFIIMEYKGAAGSKKPVCFVGKGLTFDTGGISIKPAAQMEEMKYDMCGGAAVIATLLAIAKLKLKINAIGLVPSTENMPDGAALKPGDVYTARNGKTVEVFNTDAEGRLILSDALVYASEQKPAAIFDTATLTGAILVALGNTHSGVFTRDNKLMKKIQEAADTTGELVWQMPLTDFHVDDMKGTHADLCNISNGRNAGSSTAAAFLEQFVEEGIPWAHFDIAGTAWNVNGRFPYHPKKGASGIIIRTFVELAQLV